MKNILIGTATVKYDEDGKAVFANFVPEMKVELDETSLGRLQKVVDKNKDAEKIRENADVVLSSWFSKMTDIELEDRADYQMISEVVNCEKYPSGQIKVCVLRYMFTNVKHVTSQKPAFN